jgi:hypothetical protein
VSETSEIPLALAVSTYRDPARVSSLILDLLATTPSPILFNYIVVVESGALSVTQSQLEEKRLRAGLPASTSIRWLRFRENIGAAGTLYERLLEAERIGAHQVILMNDDAEISFDQLSVLAHLSREQPNVAHYPFRILPNGRVDLAGLFSIPMMTLRVDERLAELAFSRVGPKWSSSNVMGLPASVATFRDIRELIPLWHGWEDLLLGSILRRHQVSQKIAFKARIISSYDYATSRSIMMSDKPPWMDYYTARNLILASRSASRLGGSIAALLRIMQEALVIAFAKNEKRSRLVNLRKGTVDGLRGCAGPNPSLEGHPPL